jgi:hypothetical protein
VEVCGDVSYEEVVQSIVRTGRTPTLLSKYERGPEINVPYEHYEKNRTNALDNASPEWLGKVKVE